MSMAAYNNPTSAFTILQCFCFYNFWFYEALAASFMAKFSFLSLASWGARGQAPQNPLLLLSKYSYQAKMRNVYTAFSYTNVLNYYKTLKSSADQFYLHYSCNDKYFFLWIIKQNNKKNLNMTFLHKSSSRA